MSANYVRLEGKIISIFKNLKTTRLLVRCFDLYGNTIPCIVFDSSDVKKYVDQFTKNDEIVIEGYIKVSSYVNNQSIKTASIEIVILKIIKKHDEVSAIEMGYDWINDCERS